MKRMAEIKTVHVCAAVIIENGRVFISRRKLSSENGGKWEFPGGKIEPGETREECLKRELFEEFEINALIGEMVYNTIYKNEKIIIHLYAFRTKLSAPVKRYTDHIEIAWADMKKLDSYDFSPADIELAEKIKRKEIV